MFATLTYKLPVARHQRLLSAAISVAALGLASFAALTGPLLTTPALAVRDLPCVAPADAVTKGLDAYQQGRYELAVPSFECALSSGNELQKLHANFYLARIYSDDTGGFTNHARAYDMFRTISDAIDSVDPEDSRRAPFVAKALTAFAGYVRRGLPEIGLKPDLARNAEYIRHAATFFDEPDAQFELAKLHLAGLGVPRDVPLGLHYIQKLVEHGHAPAQGYLADLYWTGTHVRADKVRALALIKMAETNASMSDHLWIEDNYQTIYCSTPAADRTKAAALTDVFRKTFGRSLSAGRNPMMQLGGAPQMALGGNRQPAAGRRCANNEPIDMELHGEATQLGTPPLATSLMPEGPQQTLPAAVRGQKR